MCQQQRPGLSFRNLKKWGAVKIEEFADAALGALNFTVYLVGGQIDKTRRDFGQQRFELQPIFDGLRGRTQLLVRYGQVHCSFLDSFFEFIMARSKASCACLRMATSCSSCAF